MKRVILVLIILIALAVVSCDVLYDFTAKPLDNIADPESTDYIDRMGVTATWDKTLWDGAVFGE